MRKADHTRIVKDINERHLKEVITLKARVSSNRLRIGELIQERNAARDGLAQALSILGDLVARGIIDLPAGTLDDLHKAPLVQLDV
jgi:hypothetical protein